MSRYEDFTCALVKHSWTVGATPRIMIWFSQVMAFAFSGLMAFLMRFDFIIPSTHIKHLIGGVLIWIFVKSGVFTLYGLNRGWWRFVSIHDAMRLGAGNLTASAASTFLILWLIPPGFPRSIFLLDLLICTLMTTAMRVGIRLARDNFQDPVENSNAKAVLIYGAGTAGITLLREIRSNHSLHYRVLGFIDDNPQKRGIFIQGVKVLGTGDMLDELTVRLKAEEILVALPSANGEELAALLNRCHSTGLKCRTIPPLAEIIEGGGLSTQLRDVAVEDLLGRRPIRLEEKEIRSSLEDKFVLITGAAGSIGSELCRQIARFQPAGIIGFEIAESPLFEIDREMRQTFPQVPFYPEIGSIQNRSRLKEVLCKYSPSVVYHAAAYKHVPMMEQHIFEAVENNIFGTYNVAVEATENGVEDFVMISSDKAVRPTNIMGATKRVSELILKTLQNGGTKYVSVRFGNVLGSSGSVIPIFKKQILAGGPVTITHPEMRRFFMTMPEACQLVLQAAVVGKSGQICVLDMGEPVKILDLAKKLILLSGLRIDQDIKIKFTGIRPGEKLYEELSTLLENTAPTSHEKIRIFMEDGLSEEEMSSRLLQLRQICENRDAGQLIIALKGIVFDYSPSVYLLQRLVSERQEHSISLSA